MPPIFRPQFAYLNYIAYLCAVIYIHLIINKIRNDVNTHYI